MQKLKPYLQAVKYLKNFSKFLAVFILILLTIEIFLRIAGFFYISANFKQKQSVRPSVKNAVRIMFIGDSWTQGADAVPGKGYVDSLVEFLKKGNPQFQIESFNYGRGSFNSSEASLVFLKHYKEIKPHILIVLMGINNIWNAQDVVLANKYFEKELNYESGLNTRICLADKLCASMNRLKIVKLFRLIIFNFFIKNENIEMAFNVNDYVNRYFQIHATGAEEEGRKYLVDHLERAPSYDDFYRIMLFSFNQNASATENYLRKMKVWKPGLIKNKFNQRRHDYYISSRFEILEKQIGYLKHICDLDGIALILHNYPYYGDPSVDQVNAKLRDIADKFHISFLDNYLIFENTMGIKKWKEILTYSHVNTEGHTLIAKNLFNFIMNRKLLPNILKK